MTPVRSAKIRKNRDGSLTLLCALDPKDSRGIYIRDGRFAPTFNEIPLQSKTYEDAKIEVQRELGLSIDHWIDRDQKIILNMWVRPQKEKEHE